MISYLANFWSEQGWSVTIVTLEATGAPDHFKLKSDVRRVRLGLVHGGRPLAVKIASFPWQMLRVAYELRRTKPTVVISFLDWVNVLTLSAMGFAPNIPTIISERIDPHANPISSILSVFRRITYRRAKALVLVCRSAVNYFPRGIQSISRVIPNPAARHPEPQSVRPSTRKTNRIIGVGRLEAQKNFSNLLSAFSSIANDFPDWELVVYGDGSQRSALEQLTRDMGLAHRIRLPGSIESTAEAYAAADIFVLPSLFEGFSNVLIEAMTAGLPVIAYDCPGANGEVIRNGENGILLPLSTDSKPLADAIRTLMQAPSLRERLGREASNVAEIFSEKRFFDSWTELVLEVVGSSQP